MRAPTAVIAAIFALAAAPATRAEGPGAPAIEPTYPPLAAHCLSRNPGRLALTDEQLAQIETIRQSHPEDTQGRRAAILKVLTRTQWMAYWRTAGIAAC